MPATPGPGGSRWLPGSGTQRCNACWGPCLAGKGDMINARGPRAQPPPRFHKGSHQPPNNKDRQWRSLGERVMGPRPAISEDVVRIHSSLTKYLSPLNTQGLSGPQ